MCVFLCNSCVPVYLCSSCVPVCACLRIVVYLCVRVVYTWYAVGSSLDELQRQQRRESDSSVHSPSLGTAATLRGDGRTRTPAGSERERGVVSAASGSVLSVAMKVT